MNALLRHAVIDLTRILAVFVIYPICYVFSIVCFGPPLIFVYAALDGPETPEMAFLLIMGFGLAIFALSLAPVLLPLDFMFAPSLGARRPSMRERELLSRLEADYDAIASANGLPKVSFHLRVIDVDEINAYAYGRNGVAISRGVLELAKETPENWSMLITLLAHEIGHIVNHDTRFFAFLGTLQAPLFASIWILSQISRIPFLALLTILPLLGCWFAIASIDYILKLTSRAMEYRADAYALSVVGAERVLKLFDHPTFRDHNKGQSIRSFLVRSHPPTELRHDRIRRLSASE
ncbi:M48 family metalloprotease [Breoghania sp.]|uniref:M48 family metalloprotease n=1 Tax=Breoghania sp. TaxID=2065378 RepID=UPI002AAA8000|nr:M48 family metalloprotease [Breoghania sp.]